eukprot:g33835.t1
MSGRTVCPLLLLCLLAAGAGSSPELPGQERPERGSSPAPPAPRAGGNPGRNGIPLNRRSGQPPLEATKAKLGALAQFFGKSRLLVLAAPDPSDNSYRLMEQQIDLKSRRLRCQLAARDLLVLILFQKASASPGKLHTVSPEGEVSEETVGAQEAAQIRQHLSLEEGQFGMVLLRKSMQLYERFPYAVRMEAVLETVDQMPLRKIESVTRRGQQLKCKSGRDRKLGSGQLLHNRRGMVTRGMVNRTTLNRGMANRTMLNRTMLNRGLGNRGMINRGMVNRTVLNSRLRSASPNSQKLVRSKSVSSSGKPGTSAPGNSPPSRRTLGKRKGSASTLNSIGKRRAESPRSADTLRESPTVPPGQRMMDQIKKKVQQMLMAKHQKPDQRRLTLVTQNRNQISRTRTHTHHIPRVHSTSSPLGGKKVENKQEGNSNKAVRNKGRKNRRNRKNKKNASRNSKQIDNRELLGFLDHFRNKRRLL